MIIETLMAESIRAQTAAQTEVPVVQSFANNQNAQGFNTFAQTVKETYNGDMETAMDHYERFCAAGRKTN